ncbi:roadblock/LC7 domain-containing protein [Streptomyces sp. NPDC058409]|uniref:roadblock/LC7 domain-containing protein n=1 Tax=Streptomyces sp. NPDC058409 TaxID=3346484 RepID=UPI00364F6ADA
MSVSTNAADTSWLLGTIPQLQGVRHTLLVTSDGLVKAQCENTPRDTAERTAAAVGGAQSLAKGIAAEFGPEGAVPLQSVVAFTDGHMFMRAAAEGSVLVVVTDAQADPGAVAQFMAQQVQQLGRNLATPARTPDPAHD